MPWRGGQGLVLIFATRNEISGQPVTGSEAFKAAAARWYVWAVLSYFIILVDKHLPIRQDAVWKRLLVHIPISCVFIAAYTYLNYWACIFLEGPSISRFPRPAAPSRCCRERLLDRATLCTG